MSAAPCLSRPGDAPALRALWKRAFGDGDDCLDAFFHRLYRPEDAFVIREGDQVAAMAFQLPMTIRHGEGAWRAAYLYAVATGEPYRGKGYATALLAYAAGVMEGRGCQALLLKPGEPPLWDFYRARGFSAFSAVEELSLEAETPSGSAVAVPPPDYLALREAALEHVAHVSCPIPVLAFQEAVAGLSGGGLFRLSQGALEGCACAAVDASGRAVIYELLWPGDPRQGASLAAAAVGAKRAYARMPGGTTPFSMVKWLVPPPLLPLPFLGIALD